MKRPVCRYLCLSPSLHYTFHLGTTKHVLMEEVFVFTTQIVGCFILMSV